MSKAWMSRIFLAIGLLILGGALVALVAGQPASIWLNLVCMAVIWLLQAWWHWAQKGTAIRTAPSSVPAAAATPDKSTGEPLSQEALSGEGDEATEEVLAIQFRLNPEDLFRFNLAQRHFPWSMVAAAFLILAAAHKEGLALIDGQATAHQRHTLGMALLVLLALVVVVSVLCWFYFRWEAVQAFEEAGEAIGDSRLEISEEGIRCAGHTGEERHPWRDVKGIRATRSHYFLYLGPYRAYIVPCRAFDSPQEAAAFLKTARRWRAAANRA